MYVSIYLFASLLVRVVQSTCPCGYPSVVHPAVRSVWLCVSVIARLKCFPEPQSLILPTLLLYQKAFYLPKPSALEIITYFAQSVILTKTTYHIKMSRPPATPTARPRARPPTRPPHAHPTGRRRIVSALMPRSH